MRSLLAALLALFLPSRGRRRATPAPVPTAPAPVNVRSVPVDEPLWGASARAVGEVLRGEDVALVRPFVVAWERQRERELQRERRTASTLATMGIDYPYGHQGHAA
ncbi:hypothetical protein GA0115245_114727 [Streptomyces sp. di188]|nr:hypothetical protein GA0115238_122827 [Streptomyces sp. di50b]SCD85272.1 hypothetical protein GA0115245_114727 [Streptomyces sp. di188]